MKATFSIPDELYREVKARSALEGRPVRELVITLFRQWLGHTVNDSETDSDHWEHFEPPLRRLVHKTVSSHSMESIRESITNSFDDTV